jgi:TPR repeat protein
LLRRPQQDAPVDNLPTGPIAPPEFPHFLSIPAVRFYEASVLHAAPFCTGKRICQPGDNLVSPAVSISWTKLGLDRTFNGCSFPAAEVKGRNRLGLLYMQGLGVPQDYVQAYFWFSLDGEEGNAADAREHLTPTQIRGVERLIDEWEQQHRPSPELAAALHIMEANSR